MPRHTKTIKMMGTVIDIMVDSLDSERIIESVIRQLHLYEQRFSANDAQSELMAVNHLAGVKPRTVHSDLYQLIKTGKEHSLAENSYLNIALGPLIKAWHIGFKDAKKPKENEISDALQLTDPSLIHLDEERQTVYLEKRDMQIDLGALAKGYIADLVIDDLKRLRVNTASINLGGNFVSTGPSPSRASGHYRIGIQDPKRPRHTYLLAVDTQNQSVVTSGIYERALTVDGKTYHHLFDPKTGHPIHSEIASLTIISSRSIDGEIWTTRLFGQDVKTILSTLAPIIDIECIIITHSNTVHYSKGLEGKITLFPSVEQPN